MMESDWNPYEAPQPIAGDDTLKETPVLYVLFFAIITCGVYQPFWYWRRRRVLNQLAPEKGIDGLCLGAFVSLGIAVFVGFLGGIMSEGAVMPSEMQLLLRLLNLVYAILMLILGFRVKGILEANYPDRISGVGVFFLNLFYLQYKINRLGQGEPRTVTLGLTH